MRCSLQNLSRAGVVFALLLSPDRLTAQDSPDAPAPAAATGQPPAVPELADLIPSATALSDRLANLEKTIADKGDLSQVELQLGEVSARVDEDAAQILPLEDASDPRAGLLPRLKAEIEEAGDTLTEINKTVTAKVRTFGGLQN